MAGLIKRRDKYYARIRKWNGIKEDEIQIPLRTTFKAVALELLKDQRYGVNKFEADIKSGVIGSDMASLKKLFPWLNEAGTSTIVQMTVSEAVEEYLHFRKVALSNRPSTIKRTQQVLNNLIESVCANRPVKGLKASHIQKFMESCKNRLTETGVHIQMTRVSCFIDWLYDDKRKELGLSLDDKPKVYKGKLPKKKPSYLSETEFADVMQLPWLSQFHKDAFTFYRATGCRLREPFYGKLEVHGEDDWWLVVSSDISKSGVPRQIKLTYQQMCFVKDMVGRRSPNCTIEHHTHGRNKNGNFSKIFKKAVRDIGRPELKFHNLRDTFALMRYLETRDIYQVSKELGHSSVKVTEKYLTHQLSMLKADFPSLARDYNARKQAENDVRDTQIRDTAPSKKEFASR